MAANQLIEKVYELLEQYDFNELSEMDKDLVLSGISEAEYTNMRAIINNTVDFFNTSVDPVPDFAFQQSLMTKGGSGNVLIKILTKPVQLYQVAAIIIVLIGIFSILDLYKIQDQRRILASVKSTSAKETDTVYSRLTDTVQIIKEKIIYVHSRGNVAEYDKYVPNSKKINDCKKELCPDDIEEITKSSSKNQFSKDSSLVGFIVSI